MQNASDGSSKVNIGSVGGGGNQYVHGDQVSAGGAQFIAGVAVSMAAAPFLQAVAGHFGKKAAEAVEASSRSLVNLLLRREPATPSAVEPEWVYACTDGGWDLLLPVDISSEGLGQLVALGTATPPSLAAEPTPRLIWQESKWVAIGAVPNERHLVQYVWDAVANSWSDAT